MSIEWLVGGAFFVSLITQWAVMALAHRYKLFIDSHKESKPQRFHEEATPRAGGIGIMAGLLFLLFTPLGWKLLFSVLLAFLSGIFEDFHNAISAKTRLVLQLVAALAAIFLTNAVVTYIGLGITLPYFIGVIFSAFAIVGVMNAINIIDGFNGLAGGIVLLILISFGITAAKMEDLYIVQLNLVTASAVCGFFVVNFPKGRIFLGDGGAYLLGFLVALSGIFLASHHEKVSPWYILCVLIYPVWEVIFSIIRKKMDGTSPLQPDRYHLHMLVYRHLTHNNPLTALALILFASPFILVPTLYPNNSAANFFTAILFICCYLLLYRVLIKKESKA